MKLKTILARMARNLQPQAICGLLPYAVDEVAPAARRHQMDAKPHQVLQGAALVMGCTTRQARLILALAALKAKAENMDGVGVYSTQDIINIFVEARKGMIFTREIQPEDVPEQPWNI